MTDIVSFQEGLTVDQRNEIVCIAAYFTDVFYNALYLDSFNMRSKSKTVRSLTEAYKITLRNFVAGTENDNYIAITVQGIMKKFGEFLPDPTYFKTHEVISMILKIFITHDVYNSVQTNEKIRIETVSDILRNIGRTSAGVVINNITHVIDTRTEESSEIVQQAISDNIARLACEYNIRISKETDSKTFHASNVVINEALIAKYKKVLAEKLELATKLDRYEQLIRRKVEENERLSKENEKLKKELSNLRSIPEDDELKYAPVRYEPVRQPQEPVRQSYEPAPSVRQSYEPAPSVRQSYEPAPSVRQSYEPPVRQSYEPTGSPYEPTPSIAPEPETTPSVKDKPPTYGGAEFSFIDAMEDAGVPGLQYADLRSDSGLPANMKVDEVPDKLFA